MMSQEKCTSSRPPRPAKKATVKPYESLLYQSTISTTDQVSFILNNHGLRISPELSVRAPLPHERSFHAPVGSSSLQYSAWSQEHLRAGALLPLKPYFRKILNHVELAPFQLQTNAYRILTGLKSLYHLREWGEPSPEEIGYLLSLKKNPPGSHGGEEFYYLASWPQEKKLFEDVPNKPQNYKIQFFWTAPLGVATRLSTEPVSNFILGSFIYSLCW